MLLSCTHGKIAGLLKQICIAKSCTLSPAVLCNVPHQSVWRELYKADDNKLERNVIKKSSFIYQSTNNFVNLTLSLGTQLYISHLMYLINYFWFACWFSWMLVLMCRQCWHLHCLQMTLNLNTSELYTNSSSFFLFWQTFLRKVTICKASKLIYFPVQIQCNFSLEDHSMTQAHWVEKRFATLYWQSSNTSWILKLVRCYIVIGACTCRHCEISKKLTLNPTLSVKNTPLSFSSLRHEALA